MKKQKPKKYLFKFREKPLKLFFKFLNERHLIYCRRKRGEPWPWTHDKILQKYKFTNVFRQLDRVTVEWQKRYVTLMGAHPKLRDGDLLFHLCMFRLFNWPETYDTLYFNMSRWNREKAIKLLSDRRDNEFEQIFTGAYIIPSGGSRDSKIETICNALQYIYERRYKYARMIKRKPTMKNCVAVLRRVHTIGSFIGYEIACDLRHTKVLSNVRDADAWANPGPGAVRGINRLLYDSAERPKKIDSIREAGYVAAMRALFIISQKRGTLLKQVRKCEWPFEMREIEHTLCEWDKHQRVKRDEGKPRSLFRPKLDDDGCSIPP